jgi:SAM-dependent methyltransferase
MYREKFYEDEKPDYIKNFEKEKEYWFSIYEERFKLVEKFIKTDVRTVLDIGSSIGYFLQAGKNFKWDVLGIEPSNTAAQYAKNSGIETINDSIEHINLPELGSFSFIHMSLVLEHIIYPERVLGNCYNAMESGGIICIEVPNEFNLLQDILVNKLGKPYYWITKGKIPHHLNYFNKNSLRTLLKKTNFKIVYETATFPMEVFVLMGDDYIGNDEIGTQSHEKRMSFEKNLLKSKPVLKENLYKKLASSGLGREIIIFARKG